MGKRAKPLAADAWRFIEEPFIDDDGLYWPSPTALVSSRARMGVPDIREKKKESWSCLTVAGRDASISGPDILSGQLRL